MTTTFDVRVQGILTQQRAKNRTYAVRWAVGGRRFKRSFATKALADSYRARLLTAQRAGVAFDIATGQPEPDVRRAGGRSWLELAMDYVDVKWPHSSPKHRRNTAEALVTVTPIFLTTERGSPSEEAIRKALYEWAFNSDRRKASEPPDDVQRTLAWLRRQSVAVADLDDAALIRKALDAIGLRRDGRPASASTVARKRAALSGVLRYAVELRLLDVHPLSRVAWSAPARSDEVDRRTVVNPKQARALLAAVRQIAPEFEAFFGCMYYSALRPEEVLHLRATDYERSERPQGWAWFNLTGATVTVSPDWSGNDSTTEDRGLKHRARTATRRVPVPPALATLLDAHIDAYGTGPDGRLFVTQRGPGGRYRPTTGRPFSSNAYTRVWRKAREKALTETQQASPLARVPYDLRHAAVSLWLNAGVPPVQVAEWAGHSVAVLLRVYAKCLDGQDAAARRRIAAALRETTAEGEGEGAGELSETRTRNGPDE